MLQNFLIVCDDPKRASLIQDEVSKNFRGNKCQSYILSPGYSLDSSSKLLRVSQPCDAAIFYNISCVDDLRGSKFIALLCEEYAIDHPDCFINYHYSEQQFLPIDLELTRNSRPRLHFQASVEPATVVQDMVRVITQHDMATFEERACSTPAD